MAKRTRRAKQANAEVAKRLRRAFEMMRESLDQLRREIRERHPNASESEVEDLFHAELVSKPPKAPGRKIAWPRVEPAQRRA